jgi:hypothetical protein
MLLGFSALFLVMTRGLIDKSLAGLLLYYIMGLPDTIYWTIFVTTYLENSMVSVERTHSLA